jgi:hypothetical protein
MEIKEAIRTNQEKTDANLTEITAEIRDWRKATTACQEAMEVCLESKEPTSVEIRVRSDAGRRPSRRDRRENCQSTEGAV